MRAPEEPLRPSELSAAQERMAQIIVSNRDRFIGYIKINAVGLEHIFTAEDIYQEVTLRAIKASGYANEKNDSGFIAYVYAIIRSVIFNHRRKKTNSEPSLEEVIVSNPRLEAGTTHQDSPARELLIQERNAALYAAVELLTPKQKLLLELKVEKLSNLEIAEKLGTSESAIKSRYFRILAVLKKALIGTVGNESIFE